jgi:membrane protease subunit (stomatin/prohibitin family)
LTTALSLPFGFESPFKAEAVYVNMKVFTNQKWGTMEPILYRDSDLAMVRLRAFGIYAYRITHPQVFVNTLVGTQGHFTTAEIADFFRNLILTQLADYLGENLKSILDLAQYYNDLSAGIKARTISDFEKYGVTLTDFKIGSISVPENVQEHIDKRSGMAAIGNLDAYVKFQAATAIEKAAEGGGNIGSGTIGTGIGLGAGMGMGVGLAGIITRAMAENTVGPTSATNAGPSAKCIKCNAALTAASKFCHECGISQQLQIISCRACQEAIPGESIFCPNCGTKL